MKKYINTAIKFCSFTILCMVLILFSQSASAQTGDCVNAQCVGVGGTYPSGVGAGNVDDMVAGGCGGVLNPGGAPVESNSAWFYADIATSGDLTLTLNTTADYDYVVWGPYTDLSDALNNGCGGNIQNTNGAAPEVTCDFTTGVPDISIPGVTVGEVYLIFLDNFTGDGASFTLGVAGTASVTCPADCAPTCAAADGNSCANYVTPAAMQVTSYGEIQSNGGEACFNSGSIDATGGVTATQCFEYTHSVAGSPGFFILSGTSIIESGDTDDSADCDQGISSIEIFDSSCGTPLVSGGQGATLNNATVGTTYTICVTGTASDNADTDAGATCLFSCMAHSVTPLAPLACTLTIGPGSAVCDAMTAGTDTYTVSIPFDNGAEGAPGAGGYTVTTNGTIGGDDPALLATGTITITLNEGTAYSYQIEGVAGSGANEGCDLTVSGASPTCDANCNADNGTVTISGN